MGQPLVTAYHELPPITRFYASACVLTTAACMLDVISPYQLYYHPEAIYKHYEVWRIFTNFVFFGTLNINWIFHMFFLVNYSRMLEKGLFHGRQADMLYMMLLSAALLLLVAPLLNSAQLFLGSSLTFTLVYIWSQSNVHVNMSFLGLVTFRAPFLPWVLLGLGLAFGNDPTSDLLGIFAGHIYYFLEYVYAKPRREGGLNGPRILKPPRLLEMIFEEREAEIVVPPERERAGGYGWGGEPENRENDADE